VFALLGHMDKATLEPLDLKQRQFLFCRAMCSTPRVDPNDASV
jgi:hypothetical protein